MIRPLIRQEKKRSSLLDDELTLALQWWLEVLQLGVTQKRTWEREQKRPVHLFCDARSTPPRVAAVLVRCALFVLLRVCRRAFDMLRFFLIDRDGRFKYCDLEPPAEVMGSFKIRGDNQIMSLEILSIALGAWTSWLLCMCFRCVCIVACQDCRASQKKSPGETSSSGQTTQEQSRPPEKVGTAIGHSARHANT